MPKIDIRRHKSYFNGETRFLYFSSPDKITEETKVVFVYDAHVFCTPFQDMTTPDGIDLSKLAEQHYIIAITTNSENNPHRWEERVKELSSKNEDGFFLFNIWLNSILGEFKKTLSRFEWVGIGFSLSGQLILENEKMFDRLILISPALRAFNKDISYECTIYYGAREYEDDSEERINKPIKNFLNLNNLSKSIKIEGLKHDFWSWRDHFDFIMTKEGLYEDKGLPEYSKKKRKHLYSNE